MIICRSFMKQTFQSQNYISYGLTLLFFFANMWCHVIKTVKKNVKSWGILNFSPSLTWWVYFTKWWSFIFFPGTPGILTYFWHLLRFLMYYQIHSWHWWLFIIKVGARSLQNFYSITDLIPCGDRLCPKRFCCQLENSYHQPSWARPSRKCAI